MFRFLPICLATILTLFAGGLVARSDEKTPDLLPSFRMQEIDTSLTVGYAVLLVDVNGDGKKDIVVVDTRRVVWYENPTWKRRSIIEGVTKPDNVCIAAYDIDGDGKVDFALGADWKPFNTKAGGTLQWLKRGKTLDDLWTVIPIGEEPVVHRIRFADVLGEGKPQLINVPLMGRDSSKSNNWMDGKPVRIQAYRIPEGSGQGPLGAGDHQRKPARDSQLLSDPVGRRQAHGRADGQLRRRQPAVLGRRQASDAASRRRQPGQPQIQPRRQRDQAGQAQERQEIHRHHRTVARLPGGRLHRTERPVAKAVGPPRRRRPAPLGPCGLVCRHRRRRRRRTA